MNSLRASLEMSPARRMNSQAASHSGKVRFTSLAEGGGDGGVDRRHDLAIARRNVG